MEIRRSYKQLRPEERMVIASLRLQGAGVRHSGRVIGRSPSTVSRELHRNAAPAAGYSSDAAQARHATRRRAARKPRKLGTRGATAPGI